MFCWVKGSGEVGSWVLGLWFSLPILKYSSEFGVRFFQKGVMRVLLKAGIARCCSSISANISNIASPKLNVDFKRPSNYL